jgi:formylglycine-generating enzyme required for sulfatase activity
MRPLRLALLMHLVLAVPASATTRFAAQRVVRGGAARMVTIPAGTYRPLYAAAGQDRIAVAAFSIDRDQVTRGQFLAFVRSHPEWRRDRTRSVFADARYLAEWPSADSAGESLGAPVTSVSWFAAKAYCLAQGKRLPTVDEWEYVAAASEDARDASRSPARRARLLALYAAIRGAGASGAMRDAANVYGVRGMHGVVWEWTLDFNSVVVADDSRTVGGGSDARDHHLYCASASIGATDPSDFAAFVRFAVRAGLTARSSTRTIGFRCASDAPRS